MPSPPDLKQINLTKVFPQLTWGLSEGGELPTHARTRTHTTHSHTQGSAETPLVESWGSSGRNMGTID